MELKIAKLDYRIFLSCFIWLQVFVIVLNLISITNSDWQHYYYGLAQNIHGKFYISCLGGGDTCYSDKFKIFFSGAIYIILSCISMTLICFWIRIAIKSFRIGKAFNRGIILGIIALKFQIAAVIEVFYITKIKIYVITEEKFDDRGDHAGTGAQMAIAVILIEFLLIIVALVFKKQVNKIHLTEENSNVREINIEKIINLEINVHETNPVKGNKNKLDSENKEINRDEKTGREKGKTKNGSEEIYLHEETGREKTNNGNEEIDLHEENNPDVKVKIKKKKTNDESQE
ncbi:hypothetical protein SteCoe_987 [Stentor coeruleus]|uniref:Uncharacterized protein n=1 Tax=Stentor coeruleus TaxID=5963 RepID=A0A1R2D2V0_9CILI|nr:hypothetical protein SteCoe_987 [Stentor coeruleus]